jgi:hypothetical protein
VLREFVDFCGRRGEGRETSVIVLAQEKKKDGLPPGVKRAIIAVGTM